jgi:hypothetical protein
MVNLCISFKLAPLQHSIRRANLKCHKKSKMKLLSKTIYWKF